MTIRHIRLSGPETLLDAVTQYFRSSSARIFCDPAFDGKGAYFLESDHLNLQTDAWAVLSRAEHIVHMVNFFALISLRDTQRIAVQMVHQVETNGARSNFILPNTGTVWPSFRPSEQAAEKLVKSLDHDGRRSIGFLMSGLDDPRSIYAALEVVQIAAANRLRQVDPKLFQVLLGTRAEVGRNGLLKVGKMWIDKQGWAPSDIQGDQGHSALIQCRRLPVPSRWTARACTSSPGGGFPPACRKHPAEVFRSNLGDWG
jgi:hypothetical protein